MRILLLSVFALSVAVLAQQDPSHPFPNHEAPPKNWYCYPANATHDPAKDPHACTCLGMQEKPDPEKLCHAPVEPCTADDQESGNCQPPRAANDNSKCKLNCHKESCLCETQCEFSSHNMRNPDAPNRGSALLTALQHLLVRAQSTAGRAYLYVTVHAH